MVSKYRTFVITVKGRKIKKQFEKDGRAASVGIAKAWAKECKSAGKLVRIVKVRVNGALLHQVYSTRK